MKPEISIGLTFYNNADTIRDALRSIFAQSFKNWELIVIDDNSVDKSFEIVQSVKDPRVRVYREDRRKGFVNALNQMTSMARGEYYARMDADDMMHPERLSKQIEYLKINPDMDVVDTAMYSMDQYCRVKGIRGIDPLSIKPENALKAGLLHHATTMGRTEWFRKNPYNPAYIRAEDCELWCRTYQTSRFDRLKEPLYFVREGRVNINNYLLSCKTVRKIIKTYGPLRIGKFRTAQLMAGSFFKCFAYRVSSSVNSHEFLVDLRNRKLSNKEKAHADNIIKQILSVPIP
jgi:glycosyltransferase involved in cell wall biosynthesis